MIYGISLAILLIVYLISVYQAHHGKGPISNNEWYYIVLLLLFAPLVVLVIPFILISDHKKEKQNKKLQQEREKRERELEARTNSAIGSFNRAELVEVLRTTESVSLTLNLQLKWNTIVVYFFNSPNNEQLLWQLGIKTI